MSFCRNCGQEIGNYNPCPQCGAQQFIQPPGYQQAPVYPQNVTAQYVTPISPLSRTVALLLAIFLGGLGVHRFYAGKVGTGILMIVTAGGLGVWWIIDIIIVAIGAFRDKSTLLITQW